MTRPRTPVPAARRLRALAAAVMVAAAGGLALLSGCDDSSGSSPSDAGSGGLPSAARSAAAAASSFAASAGARASSAAASFDAAIAKAAGQGNAVEDVQLSTVPAAQTGGLNAVVVSMANTTDDTASYAVKVEFADSGGHVVDSSVVGATDVAAGKTAKTIAFTTKERGKTLTARAAKAQRF